MAHIRVLHQNALDKAATLTASSTAAGSSVNNLLTDVKGTVHRTATHSVTYTATWTGPQSIGCVALPATNLSSEAKIRVRLYSATNVVLADSGVIFAAPGLALGTWDWTAPLNVNAFAFGGAVKSAVWFDEHYDARRVVVDISDPTNPTGYLDIARLLIGPYWQPDRNASFGLTSDLVDMTSPVRLESSDLWAERAPQYDTLTFDLEFMEESDRARLRQILTATLGGRNVFVSAFPYSEHPLLEQDNSIYGKLAQTGGFSYNRSLLHSKTVQIQGW